MQIKFTETMTAVEGFGQARVRTFNTEHATYTLTPMSLIVPSTPKFNRLGQRTGQIVPKGYRLVIDRFDGMPEEHDFDTLTHARTVVAADVEMFA